MPEVPTAADNAVEMSSVEAKICGSCAAAAAETAGQGKESIAMKSVLLIGLGRFGRHVAIKLTELGHEVMAIDKDQGRVEAALPIVTNALIGDSTRQDFMASLGVRDFDLCIVGIGDDFQSSLETTSLLKELGAKKVVARASRDVHAKFLLRYFSMGDGYAVMEVEVPDTWIGKSVGAIGIRNRYHVNIMAARIDGKLNMQIASSTVFTGKERLLILGRDEDIQKCFRG